MAGAAPARGAPSGGRDSSAGGTEASDDELESGKADDWEGRETGMKRAGRRGRSSDAGTPLARPRAGSGVLP